MTDFAPVKLAYKIFEAKDGSNSSLSPLIFLHGVTADKEIWEDIPQTLADRTKRKTIAYDARNHGESEYCDDFSFDLNIDDLFHFMDTMNIPKAILIGHSMGGITAAHAALRKPERIEMVFSEDMFIKRLPQQLLNPFVPIISLRFESVQHIPKELNETEAKKFSTDYMFSKIPENHPLFSNKEELYKARVQLKRKSDGGYELNFNVNVVLKAIRSVETLMKEPSGVYNGPAYFLYGNKSPIRVNTEEHHIKKHFPKAKLIEFDGAFHNIHTEFKEKFVDIIQKGLQE